MSDPNTLGGIVRRRRLESGYSLGQLASKVGKTAAEVRAWERDDELPEHGIIDRLVETLELDLDDLKKRLEEGKKAFEAEKKATAVAKEKAAEQEAGEPEAEVSAVPVAETDTAEVTQKAPAVPSEFPEEDSEPAPDEDDLPGFAVDDPFTPPADYTEPDPAATDEPEFDLLDAPTEAVPVPIITETAAAARA
ncbi:MAG: helix-turn-helix domain-containing protein, partial [bacterium]|nr:helix-turn-helix domain-containing protein [bacterium]